MIQSKILVDKLGDIKLKIFPSITTIKKIVSIEEKDITKKMLE